MADRHRHKPISFRPPAEDRAWLESQAEQTGRPVRAILADALAFYRAAVTADRAGNARRVLEMIEHGQVPADVSWDEKWAAARNATTVLVQAGAEDLPAADVRAELGEGGMEPLVIGAAGIGAGVSSRRFP